MSENDRNGFRPRLPSLGGIGGRAAATTLRPFASVIGVAGEVGIGLQRRAVDRVLESDELERVITTAANSAHIQAALVQATQSETIDRLIDSLIESGAIDRLLARLLDTGVLDRFFVRLLSSEGLWNMIDEIAASPAVTAAISQQGLGFADQVGGEVRERTRRADDWVERAARRLAHRQPRMGPPQPDAGAP